MDRLDAMAIFVAVIDEGSLSGAARKLGLSAASATRAVNLLEDHAGEPLLYRSTRRMRLSEAGTRWLETYRGILTDLAQARSAGFDDRTLAGALSVTAPELFGRMVLMPILEEFLELHSDVKARIVLLNRVVNLLEEGLDVAIRLADLPDSGLITVRLGEMRKIVCAAPSYLARFGAPATPEDLARHACITDGDFAEHRRWRFAVSRSARTRLTSVQIEPRIASTSAGAALDATVRGCGICQALHYQVHEFLADGRLVAMLEPFEPPPTPVHMVFHTPPRPGSVVRAFVDFSSARLRASLEQMR